jgi:Fe-S cluster assembly iron-binding protein IscA
MVTVTKGARKLLKQLVDDNIDDPDYFLRLTYDSKVQFMFMTDKERDGDQIVEQEGYTVLLIGSELSDYLQEATIDCEERTEGQCLTISIK